MALIEAVAGGVRVLGGIDVGDVCAGVGGIGGVFRGVGACPLPPPPTNALLLFLLRCWDCRRLATTL